MPNCDMETACYKLLRGRNALLSLFTGSRVMGPSSWVLRRVGGQPKGCNPPLAYERTAVCHTSVPASYTVNASVSTTVGTDLNRFFGGVPTSHFQPCTVWPQENPFREHVLPAWHATSRQT